MVFITMLHALMISIYIFSLLLVLISCILLVWHIWKWKSAKNDLSLDKLDIDFCWRQCRRRSQASGMIGLIGIGLAIYRLIPLNGVVIMAYILALGAMSVWIILLAIADVAATRIHYGRMMRRDKKK